MQSQLLLSWEYTSRFLRMEILVLVRENESKITISYLFLNIHCISLIAVGINILQNTEGNVGQLISREGEGRGQPPVLINHSPNTTTSLQFFLHQHSDSEKEYKLNILEWAWEHHDYQVERSLADDTTICHRLMHM